MDKTLKENLISNLNQLWGGYIEEFDINLKLHQISLDVHMYGVDDEKIFSLVFKGVSSYYFTGGMGSARFDKPAWLKSELSEIYFTDYIDKIKQTNLEKKKRPEYHSYSNFWLEMFTSVLLIEARKVVINGESFDLDYPPED